MTATALQIVDDAAARISQSQPAALVSSSDRNIASFLALLTEEGRALRRRYPWQVTIAETSFVTVATESQGKLDGTLVASTANIDYILNDIMWNRTAILPILGPKAPKEWQALKAQSVGGVYGQYRLRGGNLIIYPTARAGDSVYFEYVTKNWCSNAVGDTFYTRITHDDDLVLLDEEALTLGVKWRWLKAKGLEYAEDFNTYEAHVADLTTRDGTKAVINTNRRQATYFRGVVIPSGNWGV